MPLSDREQQILSDIEARLREEDPKFARAVSTKTVATKLRRRVKLSATGFLFGFLLMLAVIVEFWIGAVGVALMLASAVYGGNMLKKLGQQHDARLGGQLRGGFDRYLQDRRFEEEG